MNAGMDLDCLVAEKVLGWIHLPEAEALYGGRWKHPDTGDIWGGPGFYSTKIEVAWEVVERMEHQGFSMDLYRDFGYENRMTWQCRFGSEDRVGESEQDTVPLAICLAALKAVGVEVPK